MSNQYPYYWVEAYDGDDDNLFQEWTWTEEWPFPEEVLRLVAKLLSLKGRLIHFTIVESPVHGTRIEKYQFGKLVP